MPQALVIQTAFLGDVVLTTPLFRALSDASAPMNVTALVTPPGARVLGYPNHVGAGLKEVMVYDKRGAQRGFRAFLKLARQLRDKHFDIVISPHRSYRSAALAWLTKAPIRIGFDENALPFVWTHRVKRRREIHDVLRNLDLISPLGKLPTDFMPKPEVVITPEGREGAARLAQDFLKSSLRIGIAPGSVWGTKRWPAEKFAAVMDALGSERSARFVLIGGPGDAETAELVKHASKTRALNLAGKTTIEEMVAIISSLDLFITNDTGPMHVAAALGIPVIAIFGATTPTLGFAPFTEKSRVVEPPNPIECRPCSPHGPKTCPKKHFRCMNEITPEVVIEAAKSQLY